MRDRVFERLQRQRLMRVRIESKYLDSSIMKVHPNGTGVPRKGPYAIGRSHGGWSTKLNLVAADEGNVILWSLTPGQANDAPQGKQLSHAWGCVMSPLHETFSCHLT